MPKRNGRPRGRASRQARDAGPGRQSASKGRAARSRRTASRGGLWALGVLAVLAVAAGVWLALARSRPPRGARSPAAESDGSSRGASEPGEPRPASRVAPAMPQAIDGLERRRHETLAPRRLRGYGEVSGEFSLFEAAGGGRASVLAIRCESEEKAGIAHAKYLSDLRLLGGTRDDSAAVAGTSVPLVRMEAPPFAFAALRNGTSVFVLAAPTDALLGRLLAATRFAEAEGTELRPSAGVPMFLDSWDRYGFRFYYNPWFRPKGKDWKDYRLTSDFDYGNSHGRLGYIAWAFENLCDFAEGLTNDIWWDWTARLAERRGLPFVVNTMSGQATWLVNRYRHETQQKMPGYCGNFYKVADNYHGAVGVLSWCSREGKDVELALLQKIVKRSAARANVIDYLEPHGELAHGSHDVFLEHGPVADASYREYLKGRHGAIDILARRWTGDPKGIRSWDDVRVPEVAEFLGWGPEAVDLTGEWRIGYESFRDGKTYSDHEVGNMNVVPTDPAPEEWHAPGFDDSSWPGVQAPGHDIMAFLPKRPAVYRRAFDVDAAWRARHDRAWLYLWDLSYGQKNVVSARLNGVKIGESRVLHATPHWAAYEATSALKDGRNVVALRLPKGFLAYKVYISPDPPKQYPNLGRERNARWADFADWRGWSRVEMARRGMEMIRGADPERGIVCMAPDDFASGMKRLCVEYGGRFHNTGYMGAWWADHLPKLMRGAGLPFSLEPGGAPRTVEDFKRMMGLYHTEGIQAIHYYYHMGDVLWNEGILKCFEETLPLTRTIGKYHAPRADAAMLFSDRVGRLAGFPWGQDPDTNLPLKAGPYLTFNVAPSLIHDYPLDAVTELDFPGASAPDVGPARSAGEDGIASKYSVIIDTNTSIMDEALVARIEEWVREGGTFVTFTQTGRHTPEERDAWPISRLTGYEVVGVDRHDEKGYVRHHAWRLAPGQTVFPADFPLRSGNGNGLTLKKVAPECEDLVLWEDGSPAPPRGVAAGVRPLGKGRVVHLGFKFCQNPIWWDGREETPAFYRGILKWRGAEPIPAGAARVRFRHYVANSGLYDLWVLFNENKKGSVTTDLVFRDRSSPARCVDVLTGKTVELAREDGVSRVRGIDLGPFDTRTYLTPRAELAPAPLEWFELQRDWWRAAKEFEAKPLPDVGPRHALDLTDDWACAPLEEGTELDESLVNPGLDDSKWKRRRLAVWFVPEDMETTHAVFRRELVAPAAWRDGETYLWLSSWHADTVERGWLRVWLDGDEIRECSRQRRGARGVRITDRLRPGERQTIAVEVAGEAGVEFSGPRGNTWLAHIPAPDATVDLAGEWEETKDALHWSGPVTFPGKWAERLMARRRFTVDADQRGRSVFLHMETGWSIVGAIVNGTWVRRHHHNVGDITHLNVTPWVRFGAGEEDANEIEIVGNVGERNSEVRRVMLYLYEGDRYP